MYKIKLKDFILSTLIVIYFKINKSRILILTYNTIDKDQLLRGTNEILYIAKLVIEEEDI